MNYFINRVHIQGADICNASCVMCPRTYKENFSQIMPMSMFEDIIQQVNEFNIKNGFYGEVMYSCFLQSEPFVDPLLKQRINFVLSNYNNFRVNIITNGFLIEKFKDFILDKNISINFSLFNKDYNVYKDITGLSISEEKFEKILETVEYIKYFRMNKKTKKVFKGVNSVNDNVDHVGKDVLLSRAGFLDDGEIKNIKEFIFCMKNETSKEKYIGNWINILSDGRIIPCCHDYTEENILGDLRSQTLESSLKSSEYQDFYDKISGRVSPEYDFICRKCESSY